MNIITTSILFALVSAKTTPVMTEKIEARVGTSIITSTDLNLMIERMKKDSEASERTIRDKALEFLVDQALITQYLDSVDMAVSSREVDQQLDTIRKSNGISSTEEFRNLLQQQGVSFQAFRQNLKKPIREIQVLSVNPSSNSDDRHG